MKRSIFLQILSSDFKSEIFAVILDSIAVDFFSWIIHTIIPYNFSAKMSVVNRQNSYLGEKQ